MMNAESPIELKLQVSAEDVTEEDIDLMTRKLPLELRVLDVESARLTQGDPTPRGSKGDIFSIGSIALEGLPAAIPGLVKFFQAWNTCRQGRTVKIRGNGIEFEGPPEEFRILLATLEKGKKKK